MVKASMTTESESPPSIPPFFARLAEIISGDMDCSYACLKAHSVDGSPYSLRPQTVLYPKNTTDIKHAIAFAQEYNMPLTPCGGMQARSGGALCEGIIIDMTRYFSRIKNMNIMEHTVTVDAGVPIDDLIEKLDSWNMEIPVLEKEHTPATIGGLVATKSATGSTFHTGSIREWIEGVTIVVDSGEEHHLKDGISPSGRLLGIYQSIFPLLSKNGAILRASRRECNDDATGYSLWNISIGPRQLMDHIVGSEGTLAIITSVTFRIIPKKRHTASVLFPISKLAILKTTIDIAKHHQAERIFIFDETFRNMTAMLHQGFFEESLPATMCTLLVTLRDDDQETLTKRMHMLSKNIPASVQSYRIDEEKAVQLASKTFLRSLFLGYVKNAHVIATAGEGIIVPLHVYASCMESLDKMLGLSGRLYTITGYAGSGHISITTAFDGHNLAYAHDLQTYRENIFSIVQDFKGGISAVGGDGLERTVALPYVFNESTLSVFKKIKECWDPQSIFNPSKKIHITKEYLSRHTISSLE